MSKPPKAVAISRLERIKDRIADLRLSNVDSPEFQRWRRDALVATSNNFNEKSTHVDEFKSIQFHYNALVWSSGVDYRPRERQAFQDGLTEADAVLGSMIGEIAEYWEAAPATNGQSATTEGEPGPPYPTNKKVFIVHGHDDGLKQEVARVLTQLGLVPIILHEQANMGRTIIEKFEANADVAFAIALFTPDDLGEAKAKIKELADLKPRARQNVVFELGYFVGRYRRSRACALVAPGVETPSDYAGVVYVPLGTGDDWKFKLVRELKAAEFDVDANKVL